MIIETITQTNPDLGREKLDQPHFDSQLKMGCVNGMTNAELKVILKVKFEPVTWDDDDVWGDVNNMKIRDADKTTQTIVEWPDGAFDAWVALAIKQINLFWNGNMGNGKLWLQTPDYVSALDWPARKPTHRPNVWCRFELRQALTDMDAHIKVRVVRLPANQTQPLHFRSHMTLWDSADLNAASFTSSGTRRPFYTAVHETGHCLGQHHVGEVHQLPSCTMMSQENGCYGSFSEHAGNVMGLGDKLQPCNAITWQKRLVRHLPKDPSDWADWAATNTRIYPRMLSKMAPYAYQPVCSVDAW